MSVLSVGQEQNALTPFVDFNHEFKTIQTSQFLLARTCYLANVPDCTCVTCFHTFISVWSV